MKNKTLAVLAITLSLALAAKAQVAQGGTYKLEQAVIAGGGGTSADGAGNIYSITGAIGQAVAGDSSGNAPFTVNSGFFTPQSLAPTAASVSIKGRILTPDGRGLMNARIVLTDMQGNSRTVSSGAFGYFRFAEVEAGETYILAAISKRYKFAPQVLSVSEDIDDISFIAQPTN